VPIFGWLRRRRLSNDARRRLVIALAKAEEALIETHVRNALDVLAAVRDEVPLDRVLDVYLEALEPHEPRASIVARRVLSRMDSGPVGQAGGRTRGGRALR
jgi:DNA-binding MarR family transcriptional regulator